MLFTPGSGKIIRLHAPFTSEEEIEKIVEFLKSQRSADYDENFLAEEVSNGSEIDNKDELYEEAKQIILNEGKTSISYLQRRLQIGYNRAANIIEQLEFSGVLSSPNSKGQREILI
jgi:S-DNA-T family DNA segregation ATPase FtsK/SpoIIIE